ncbi:hypothetical protein [Aeromonas jandaei]|uniref:hypothetical protein n=1 Tax=Aeromonas jandaei TaxID=650 RepID=UPI001F3DE115|nr:hypothetical protein [Aeromonas jandaei]
MRIEILVFFISQAISASTNINLLEWGYLPVGYEKQFSEYARDNGVDATVTRVEPLASDFDSIFNRLRDRSVDVVIPTTYYYKSHHNSLFKLLHPLDFGLLKNYEKLQPSFKMTEYDEFGGERYSVPLAYTFITLAYDSSQVSPPHPVGMI